MYGENTKTIAIPIYRVLPYPVMYAMYIMPMRTGVVYSEGSIEMSSTILKTAVVTVTPTPGDSSALSGSIMAAIAIAVVAVASCDVCITLYVI